MIISDSYIDRILNEEMNAFNNNANKSYKQPRLRIYRLTEDKKQVPIQLDIQVNENFILRERFDWNLNENFIRPSDFVEKLCNELNLPESNKLTMKNSILEQIIHHIEKNTFFSRQRTGKGDLPQNEGDQEERPKLTASTEKINIVPQIFTEKDQSLSRSVKLTARQKKLLTFKKVEIPKPPVKVFSSRKTCKYCKYQHHSVMNECKSCKMPFTVLDDLNLSEKIIKLAVRYYQEITKKIPFIVECKMHKELTANDFQSALILKTRLFELLKSEDFLVSLSDLDKYSSIMDSILGDFLKGKFDNELEEISRKEEAPKKEEPVKKEEPKKEAEKEKTEKTKQAPILPEPSKETKKKRGRPKKKKTGSKKGWLVRRN